MDAEALGGPVSERRWVPTAVDFAGGEQARYPALHERQIAVVQQLADERAERLAAHARRVARESPDALAPTHRGRRRAAWCVELKRRFDSLSQAARFVARPTSNIYQAIRKRQRCATFHWEYFDPKLHR